MTIKFYGHKNGQAYAAFSNFSKHPVNIAGKSYKTSEHYFQAAKFFGTDETYAEKVRNAKTPLLAKQLGRSKKHPLRSDWEQVKVDIMRTVVRAKFSQHGCIRELLLSTGDLKIVEHTGKDNFWGDGGNGKGQNWLGRVLMEIRTEFRQI